MDPFDFLGTCERLMAAPLRSEADDRTVVSRIYYAFFLTLRDGLSAKDRGFNQALRGSGADHGLVRRYLRGERFTNGQSRGRIAQPVAWYESYLTLYEWRGTADYDIASGKVSWHPAAARLLHDAKALRPLIESYVRR